MGEANRRGTYEERVRLAKLRKNQNTWRYKIWAQFKTLFAKK